jgi:trimeric autotransporter adhesin
VKLNDAGDRLAVSAPNAVTPYVKVYENSGTWTQIGDDIQGTGGDRTARYGLGISGSGDILAVGSEGFDGSRGRVRVFEYNNGTNAWDIIGVPVTGESAGDWFGVSVALNDNGTVFVAGGYNNDGGGSEAGHARVYSQTLNSTWTGNISNAWNVAGNWDVNAVPVNGNLVFIPAGLTNYPTILAAAACTDLTINSDATGSGSILGQSNLTVSGVTTVNRYMSGNAWHLVTATAAGQTITGFLADNSNIPTSGASRGMMDYNEGTNTWNTFFTNAQAGNLDAGKGFSVRTSADGEVVLTGTLQGGNLNVPVTTTGQGWNNVGNPYPSAINMNSEAGLTNNFLTVNDANFDPSYKAVYVWEQGNSAYTIINSASGAYDAALGQAFMVKANTGVTQMSFTTAMQTHSPGAVLKSGMESGPSIKLLATLGVSKTSTIIKFDDNMSEGLDAGYDAGMFKTGFDLYTRLVKDNGVDFGIQCLPVSVINNGEIVLGFQSTKSGAVSFSAETENLPLGTRIVLEDRLNQTLTELKAGEVYTTQVEKGEAAQGRFYLRTSLGVTGLNEVGEKSAFRIYQAESRIYISGIVEGKADATLYDLMGRTVKSVRLENSMLNSIESSGLTNGVYMVKINHARGIFSQKVLVKNQ